MIILSVLTSIYLLAGIIYLGARKEGYSHIRHTISELGEKGATHEMMVNYGLFLPVGISLFFISFQSGSGTVLQGLSFCVGAGYAVAAFFPCDVGSPIDGSWRQQIHNLGGFVEYGGGVYFLFRGSNQDLYSFLDYGIIATIVLISTILISFPQNPIRGLIQRVAEIALFGSIIQLTHLP